MKVLVITTKSPLPLIDGRALRTFNLVKAMARVHELHLVSFVQDDADAQGIEDMREICPVVVAVPLYRAAPSLRLIADALLEPFGRMPLQVLKYFTGGMRRAVRRLMAEHRYDLVHLDMLHLAGYLPLLGDVPTLLMEHNVEAQIIARRADNEAHLIKRAYLRYQQRKLERFEARACRTATTVVAVSDLDAEQLNQSGGRRDVVCVTNGVDCDYFKRAGVKRDGGRSGEPTLVYVGGFTWFPNLDAIGYFSREILPLVRSRVPDVRVKVVGRYVDGPAVREIAAVPGIDLLGLVDDIRPIVDAADVYMVPLRIGGGTRLKILDALAMSKPVVSTSIGCEGLRVRDGRDILVADTPQLFADRIVALLEDADRAAELGERGRSTVEQEYDWSVVSARLGEAYAAAARTPTPARLARRDALQRPAA